VSTPYDTEAIDAGLWLRGPPGSGRSTALRDVTRSWAGPAVHLRGHALDQDLQALAGLGDGVLRCIDDAPEGLDRSKVGEGPVVATGGRPGLGWTIQDLPALSTDDGVRLFLRHAPGARPLDLVRQLVRTLGGHPTAVVAAARRWPLERLDAILVEPSPGWPGLRDAWQALADVEQHTLALICALGGTALRAGLVAAQAESGLPGLVASGWAAVTEPGVYRVSPALAQAVSAWRPHDPAAYLAWFLDEARARAQRWDRLGGSRAWFALGDWSALSLLDGTDQPWFFQAWSLSDRDPQALVDALDAAELDPVVDARCRARALQCQGQRTRALLVLEAVQDAPASPERALALVELGVAHHRLRHLDEALAAYDQAAQGLAELDHPRGRMLCEANRAAVAHDRNQLEQAAAGYARALRVASSLGELRLRGMFGGNLGALRVEQGELHEARASLQQAARDLANEGDDRFLAIVTVNLAAVDLLEGHYDAADTRYARALTLFGESDPASAALCHARRGAVAALQGHVEAARAHHTSADARVQAAEDPHTSRVVSFWRALLEWSAGDRASALRRRRDALAGDPPLVDLSDEARLVLRLLEQLTASATQVITVGPGGGWFRLPGQEVVDISRYSAPSQILAHLAGRAEASPGAVSDADDLIAAGWPGQRIVPDAARNRLSVALAQLRKQGLRGVLQRTGDGWRLDPEWPTVLLREGDES